MWAKGYDRLIDLLVYSSERLGRAFHLDVYGSGPDRQEIEERATANGCDLTFFPATDHSKLGDYSVFINPSVRLDAGRGCHPALAEMRWSWGNFFRVPSLFHGTRLTRASSGGDSTGCSNTKYP